MRGKTNSWDYAACFENLTFPSESVAVGQGVKKESWGKNVEHVKILEIIGNVVGAMQAG